MRSDWREPFFVLFVILALAIGLLVWARQPDNAESRATFGASSVVADPTTTPLALPTAKPTPVPRQTPSEALLSYSAEGIVLSGEVLDEAVANALLAAARQLIGRDLVDNQLQVIDAPELTNTRLTLEGTVVDEAERGRVIAIITGIGVTINDQMLLQSQTRSIVDVVAETPELAQLDGFIAASTLLDLLAGTDGSYTLFAPSDEAFLALDTATITALTDLELLAEVLGFHVVEGGFTSAELAGRTLTTVQGSTITVTGDDATALRLGDATLSTVDLQAANGYVHIIDIVQIPSTVATEVALNRVVELDPVQFAAGSATILDSSLAILDTAAQLLLAIPGTPVEIQGHTDTDGGEGTNLALSQQRADAVRDYLTEAGIDPTRLTAVGYGETMLKVDPEVTPADKAINRRIEFRVDR